MTLERLGQEYLRQAEDLKGVIKSCSALKNGKSGIELYEINNKITILKEMEREARITGMQLTEYYENKSAKRRYHPHRFN